MRYLRGSSRYSGYGRSYGNSTTAYNNFAKVGTYTKPRGTLAIFGQPKANYSRKFARLSKKRNPKGRHATKVKNVAKFDLDIGTFTTSSLGSNITKGTDYGSRIGNRIFVKGLHLQYQFVNTSSAVTDNAWVRMFVLEDKFNASSTVTDTWMTHGDSYTPVDYDATGNTLQLIDRWNPQRFNVIWDRKFSLNVNRSEAEAGHDTVLIDQYIPIRKWMTFNDSATPSEQIKPLLKFGYFIEGDNDLAPKGVGLEIFKCDGRQYLEFINP